MSVILKRLIHEWNDISRHQALHQVHAFFTLITTAINDFGAMVAKKNMSISTGPARSDNFENKDG